MKNQRGTPQQQQSNQTRGSPQQRANKQQTGPKLPWTVSKGANHPFRNDNEGSDLFLLNLLGIGPGLLEPPKNFLNLGDIAPEHIGKMVDGNTQDILRELLQKNQAHRINNDDNSSEISNIRYNSNGRRRNTKQIRNDLLRYGLLNDDGDDSDNNLLTEQTANRMAEQFLNNTVGVRNNVGIKQNNNQDDSQKGTLSSSRQKTQRGKQQKKK